MNLPFPFPDALQEFSVETGGLSTRSGLQAGALVNVVTKSGTNQFHGDLFEFVRNDLFNARPYFAIKGNTLKRNQFGGTLGGPIKRDKLFFFTGFEYFYQVLDTGLLRATVPTPGMINGDFSPAELA